MTEARAVYSHGVHARSARFLSQFRNTPGVPRAKTTLLTPHSRELGPVFEGPGLTDTSFCRTIFEWGYVSDKVPRKRIEALNS